MLGLLVLHWSIFSFSYFVLRSVFRSPLFFSETTRDIPYRYSNDIELDKTNDPLLGNQKAKENLKFYNFLI